MEDLPLGRTEASDPEFAVKDLPLGKTQLIIKWFLLLRIREIEVIIKIIYSC